MGIVLIDNYISIEDELPKLKKEVQCLLKNGLEATGYLTANGWKIMNYSTEQFEDPKAGYEVIGFKSLDA